MICELEPDAFDRCIPLLEPDSHVEAKAVVEGVNSGRIFVNNSLSPEAGMVWLGNNDGFFFIGNEGQADFNNEIVKYVEEVIKPEMVEKELFYFEMMGNHSGWHSTVQKLFIHRSLTSCTQHVFILKPNDYVPKNTAVRPPYKIKKITKAFYEEERNIINISYLDRKIQESWSSKEDFFKKGLGYCIVCEDEIVGICHTNFAADKRQCIAIEISEAHQNQGLAKTIGHYYVKDCFRQGFLPYWDCMDSNKSSQAVADHLGFTHQFSYPSYAFSFINF
ncbi:GNAT family N-acetyltransferase [Alteribacillus sp. YIM 98480]|uniref:GNAT family N-acetyltransferase n=1 Tax=Alteribacillus sp. YIM 98480 TaxID=2606599 RepID=UPI00131A70B3|nr:GNAT family N-acetyltransferase [Alteribacillus sp. YIM 98480]